MTNFSGQSFGRYRLLEKLGEGGMAIVYKAFDTRLETEVAVKVIRTERLTEETKDRALKRFEREAKALARLTHPNIVKVMDYGEHEGKPYLVMPYLPGGTLKQKMGKPVPWSESSRILLPIIEALEFSHSQGMVHRDVKPSNILLTHGGQPMLTDFGIAKILDNEETMDLTGTSAAVGTPEYMAPEQTTAKSVDHRADIYALGVVIYEMVTGRKPFQADTPMAVLIMHARDPLPSPKAYIPDLPQAVENILIKTLAKRPEDRFQSMAELASAIRGVDGSGEKSVTATDHPGKPEKKLAIEKPAVVRQTLPAGELAAGESVGSGEAVQNKKWIRPLAIFLALLMIGLAAWFVPKFVISRIPTQTRVVQAGTSMPTSTSVPATPTVSIKDTPQQVTPTATPPRELSPGNIQDVVELSRIGDGKYNTVDWSQDGEYFAIGSSTGFYLFEAATGKEMLSARTSSGVKKISLSMENKTIAIVMINPETMVQVWDLESITIRNELQVGHPMNLLELDPEGRILAVSWPPSDEIYSAADGEVQLWDVASGNQLHALDTVAGGLSFNSDGSMLATIGDYNDNVVNLWDVKTGDLFKAIPSAGRYISSVLFHPQQPVITWVETSREKGSAPDPCGCGISYIYSDMRRFYSLTEHGITMSTTGAPMMFNTNGDKYTSLVWDRDSQTSRINLYEVGQIQESGSFEVSGQLESYRLSSDDASVRVLSFGGEHSQLILSAVDVTTKKSSQIKEFNFSEHGFGALAKVNENQFAVLDTNGSMTVFAADSGGYLNSITSDAESPFLSLLPLGKDLLFAGLKSGEIELWDTENWTLQRTISERQNGEAESLALSPAGDVLVAGGYEVRSSTQITGGKEILWDIQTGDALQTMYPKYVVSDTKYSADGNHVVGAAENKDHVIYDWDPVTGKLLGRMDYHIQGFTKDVVTVTLALSPDSRTLAVGFSGFPSWDYSGGGGFIPSPNGPQDIQIWDLQTHSLVEVLPGENLSVHSLEFNLDGTMLLAGTADGTINVWDAETFEKLAAFAGHGDVVTDILFDPDGIHFYSSSQDGTINIWGIP